MAAVLKKRALAEYNKSFQVFYLHNLKLTWCIFFLSLNHINTIIELWPLAFVFKSYDSLENILKQKCSRVYWENNSGHYSYK